MNNLFQHITKFFADNSGLLKIVSIGILPFSYFVWRWVKSSAILHDFYEDDIKNARRFFVANDIDVYDGNNRKLKQGIAPDSQKAIENVFEYIMSGKQKAYFLIAPTGVGKTTFLLNLHDYYRKKSRFSFKKPLITAHIHGPNIDSIIKKLGTEKDNEEISFKFWKAHPREIVLLLDGLDEYNNKSWQTQEEFWLDFNKRWDEIRALVGPFGKVVISVREQFFQEKNNQNNGFDGNTIGNRDIHQLRLQLFDDSRILDYINKRYRDESVRAKCMNTIKNLKKLTINYDNTSIFSSPLILNYIEDLTEDNLQQSARKRAALSNVKPESILIRKRDVYDVITEKWLNREAEDYKLLSDKEIDVTREFCEHLAYHIASSETGDIHSVGEAEFLNFEENFFKSFVNGALSKSFIRHLGDRSLLQKGRHVTSGKTLRYIHASFMEYFLACYALKVTSEESVEKMNILLTNVAYTFTREMLIESGWERIKYNSSVPKSVEIPHQEYIRTFTGQKLNCLSSSTLVEWAKYIDNISVYSAIRCLLKKDLNRELMKSDPDWKSMFTPLKNLVITNDNFSKNGILIPEVENLIYYIKDFINYVLLKEINIQSEDLKCFTGASNISVLMLDKLGLSGDVLKYFSKSAHNIFHLNLQHNHFHDVDIAPLKGIGEKLKVLFLSTNHLTGSCFDYFSRPTSLNKIAFCYNYKSGDIQRLPTIKEVEKILPKLMNYRWLHFEIDFLPYSMAYEYFLKKSTTVLETLIMSLSCITDDEFKTISNFTALTNLALTYNTELTGKNFGALKSCKDTLKEINLTGTYHLHPESLSIFLDNDFKVLKTINIRGCAEQSAVILEQLSAKGICILKDI